MNPKPLTITSRELAGTLYALAETSQAKAESLRKLDLVELAEAETSRAMVLFAAATELLLMENGADL